jgi:hypothetical protein
MTSSPATKKHDRRTLVVPPERRNEETMVGMSSQAWTYFQSFMLLHDAAKREVHKRTDFTRSRFIPASIIMLHAFMDAQINEDLCLILFLSGSTLHDPIVSKIKNIIKKPLSSTSQKPQEVAALYEMDRRPIPCGTVEEVNIFCDVRDILFHTEPNFVKTNEMPKCIEDVCRRSGVKFVKTNWVNLASDMKVLQWAYRSVRAYFAELSSLTGGLDPIEQTYGGKRQEAHNIQTGEISYVESMVEGWAKLRNDLFPCLNPDTF